MLNDLHQVFFWERKLLWMLVVLVLQILQQHLLFVVIQLVQINHHLLILILIVRLLVLLLVVLYLQLLLNFNFILIVLAIVPFFRLFVHVLLHNELLEFSHLVWIQVKTHFSCCCNQIWVDRRLTCRILVVCLLHLFLAIHKVLT